MSETAPSGLTVIQQVLGERFSHVPSMRRGSSHSGHGVRFGQYEADGQQLDVAAKPYINRKAIPKAKFELGITNSIRRLGFATLRPIEVVTIEEQGITDVAVLLTAYEQGYGGGNTLTIEADAESDEGKRVGAAVGSVAMALAQMHSKFATHGDPKLKNFGFRTSQLAQEPPIIFDLEKASIHSSRHGRKVEPKLSSPVDVFTSSIQRDWQQLAFSLGARQYGNNAENHLNDTVIDPYMETVSEELKGIVEYLPVIGEANAVFTESKNTYALKSAKQ